MATYEPESFGRYYLVDKIAVGGMAEVFKAKSFSHGGFEKLLVIKRILDHLSDNDEFVEMFIDEAKISVELQHPNIVQIYDFGKLSDNYFIAMECVEGKDVKGILRKLAERRKLLPQEFAVYIAHEMCKGLDYAHKKANLQGEPLGIVHRDISPSNILVAYTGEVKIADFGIAKAENSLYNTKDGVLKGKFEYMSPEQASGKSLDFRSDIFAAGIILHEMLTGRRLFKTDSEVKTLEKVKTVDISSPSEVNPTVPARLDDIVMRALSRDPTERFADAKAFQQALLEYMYPSTPDLTRESLQHFLSELFSEEIEAERGRLEQGTKLAAKMYEAEPELDLDEDWQEGKSSGTQTLVQGSRTSIAVIGGVLAILLVAVALLAWRAMQEPQVIERVVERAATSGALQIKVKPATAEATFFIDGVPVGTGTDHLAGELVPDQEFLLRVEAPGFETFEETLSVAAGERLVQWVPLAAVVVEAPEVPVPDQPDVATVVKKAEGTNNGGGTPAGNNTEAQKATARISSTPPGASVYIDGNNVGRTPTTWTEGTPGSSHTVELRMGGFDSATFSMTVPAKGQSETFSRTLSAKEKTPGKVSVNVSSGWAEVWIDGKKVDTTPLYNHSLQPGSHTIRVVNPQTGLDESKTITVTSDESTSVSF